MSQVHIQTDPLIGHPRITLSEDEDYLTIGRFDGFGWKEEGAPTLGDYVVECDALFVAIDIKPGSATNPINLDAPGKVQVDALEVATRVETCTLLRIVWRRASLEL